MKIVNGTIVREGDVPPSSNAYEGLPTTEGGSSAVGGPQLPQMPEFFRRTLPICGTEWSYGYISFLMLISLLINGIGGVFFTGAVLGGLYLYGQRSQLSQGGGGASAPGSSGGMQRMSTRGSGGANIKGISDLPKPVNR